MFTKSHEPSKVALGSVIEKLHYTSPRWLQKFVGGSLKAVD